MPDQDRFGSIIGFVVSLCALSTPVAVLAIRSVSSSYLKLLIIVLTLLFIVAAVIHRFWLREWLFWRRFCKAYKQPN